jgi:hypothetical protein
MIEPAGCWWLLTDICQSSEDDDDDGPPEELEGEDLEYVIKLHAASGRCSMLLMDKDKATESFQANLDVSHSFVDIFSSMVRSKCAFLMSCFSSLPPTPRN